jgi:hypothetical protein
VVCEFPVGVLLRSLYSKTTTTTTTKGTTKQRRAKRAREPLAGPSWLARLVPQMHRVASLAAGCRGRLQPASRTCTGAASRLAATRQWLNTVVLAERLCPFAAAVSSPNKLRMRASEATDVASLTAELAQEADLLAASGSGSADAPQHETTLLVLPAAAWCSQWRDLVSMSWTLQAEAIAARGHGQAMQIVLFHPSAVRSAYTDALVDAADYSLRSPFPIVQLLREADVLAAVRAHPDPEGIPSRNAARLRALGEKACYERLEACLTACAAGGSVI